ncbi:dATP pyrophosphohydrolase [Pseudovibrio denitrificans]|uniref:dATP pyrophosphohydrolase n=1 Tax=Pseudovibrio denitrificans TaxID=258256 RepID=A0A1I7DB98_9HYPH|nr:NUDIX domain-containing protein [Pseudovibrio denitrificans]SFU08993.1 dATP pyrophosphohydrolase [Pseudovibrio denitrificans]
MSKVPVFCSAATVFLIDKIIEEPQVLLLRRTKPPVHTWSQISGGIEGDETAWQAMIREVQEETGITLKDLWSADADIHFYVPEQNSFSILPVFVSHVSRNTPVTLNKEHDAYQWFSFADAKALVSFPGQRQILDLIEDEFINRTPTPHLRINLSTSQETKAPDLYARASP